MHPRPPKSAPGRLKSKQSVLKDIEEWVLEDCMLAQEKTRHSGHPPENITEERLLKTRLMEMGKERFKALSKLNSDKQLFMEKQKRRICMMKRARDENNFFRNRSRNGSPDQRGEQSFEMPPLGVRRDFSKKPRPKTVQFQNQHKGHTRPTGLQDVRPHTVAVAPRNLSTTLMSTDATGDFMLNMNVSNTSNELYSMGLSRTSTSVSGFSRSESLLDSSDITNNRSLKNRGNPLKSVGITSEPRYALLEAALSENYAGHCKLDVRSIIERTESLQKEARVGGKEARRALQQKVRQFMFERDLSFKNMLV